MNILNEEQRPWRRFARELMKPVNTAAIVLLGVMTFLWGFWIANPWWSVFDRAPIYRDMEFLPEWWWGGIAMIVGALMVYGVVRRSYRSLSMGSSTGFYHWLAISILVWMGDWRNTGGIVYSIITLYCAFIWLNIRLNRDNLEL